MIRTTLRTARKARNCGDCRSRIQPGDRYLEHVVSPDHEDLGNTRWRRSPECEDCAEGSGRGHLLVKPKPHPAGKKRSRRQKRVGLVEVQLPEPAGATS